MHILNGVVFWLLKNTQVQADRERKRAATVYCALVRINFVRVLLRLLLFTLYLLELDADDMSERKK